MFKAFIKKAELNGLFSMYPKQMEAYPSLQGNKGYEYTFKNTTLDHFKRVNYEVECSSLL